MKEKETYQYLVKAVHAARIFDSHKFLPLFVADVQVGWIGRQYVDLFADWSDMFLCSLDKVQLRPTLNTVETRSEVFANIAMSLAEKGLVTGWRDELCDVAYDLGTLPIFRVERAAARFFGITTYAVHLNGVVRSAESWYMWLARRSKTKSIDPGKLDNLVGGGIATGLSVRKTLMKEAWEEAGMPESMLITAIPRGRIRVLREVPEGVQSEILFVRDLVLPIDFQPWNQDGEVCQFTLFSFLDVLKLLEETDQVTLEASLVIGSLDACGLYRTSLRIICY